MGKYEQLAIDIVKEVGGKENIISLGHCVTRLRFTLKDESKANDDVLKNMDGVVTVMKAGGQYQVVIGNHVPEVYKETCDVAGISSTNVSNEKKQMSFKDKTFDLIQGIMMPSIAILCAAGMIQGLNTLFSIFGLYGQDSSYYVLMNAIGQVAFYFFPVFLGYNTAKKLGGNTYLGMSIGLILCYPAINGTDMTFFGQTMNVTYTSSVLPVVLIVALAVPLEKWLNKVIPDVVKTFLTPMLVMMIAVPIGYTIIGPVANMIGIELGKGINSLAAFSPLLAGLVIGAFWQVFVMFGVHVVLIVPSIINLTSGTPDFFMAAMSGVSFAQTAVVFAIWLKTKDRKLKNIALPAWISGIFGVTEPAIYGVTLPRIKFFIISCIGGGVYGAVIGFFGTMMYGMAGFGIFAAPAFINTAESDASGMMEFAIACLAAIVVSFVLTFIMFKDDEKVEVSNEEKSVDNVKVKKEVLVSPIKGEFLSLSEVSDAAFSGEIMGKGLAIEPSEGKVFAPCDGTVLTIFPTKHAIGLITENGAEVLIHIGMDTVRLEGKYFETHVEQAQKVKKGDLLVSFDMDAIKSEGYLLQTPMIITNTNDYLDIIPTEKNSLSVGEEVLTLLN